MLLTGQPALPADSTSLFNPKVLGTNIEQSSTGGVPVGTIIAWPSGSNPDDAENWLECNGQAMSQSVYPELFAVVGGAVPDYRGLFLRGVGGNSAPLGELQQDAFKQHNHAESQNTSGRVGSVGQSGLIAGGMPVNPKFYTGLTGEIETRPVNKAVRYLMRALP